MEQNLLARIHEATRLVRAGDVAGATDIIQSNLLRQPGINRYAPDGGTDRGPPSNIGIARPKPRRSLGETVDLLKRMGLASNLRQPTAPRNDVPLPEPVPTGAIFLSLSFACDAGQRKYKLYIPACTNGSPRPLVIMLHGCTQDPDDFAAGTGMNRLAEELNFLVAYPEQSAGFNQMRCWNWFNPNHQMRGRGEPAIIAGIARSIIAKQNVDPGCVFAVGLSAGGAMAAVLGATYPDIFAGIGIHSGLPPGVANDVPSAFAAMRNQLATCMVTKRAGTAGISGVPRTIVFHGTADTTVHPDNGSRLFAEACSGQSLSNSIRDGIALGGRRYSVSQAVSASGETIAEYWLVHGAGHAWSGGRPAGSYTDPEGPNASGEMLRFFGLH